MKYKVDISSGQIEAIQEAFEVIVGKGTLESFEYRLDVPEPRTEPRPRRAPRPRRRKTPKPEEEPSKDE